MAFLSLVVRMLADAMFTPQELMVCDMSASRPGSSVERTRILTWRLMEPSCRGVPRDFHSAFLIVVDGFGAGGGVDRDAATAGDEADDAVAGKRIAAASEADQHVIEIGDDDRVAGFAAFLGGVKTFLRKLSSSFLACSSLRSRASLGTNPESHVSSFVAAVTEENVELFGPAHGYASGRLWTSPDLLQFGPD